MLFRVFVSVFVSEIGITFSFLVTPLSGFGTRIILARMSRGGVFHLYSSLEEFV